MIFPSNTAGAFPRKEPLWTVAPLAFLIRGLGGLTAVSALRELLPGEDVVYFGDTGRVPYGTRSAETIFRYAAQDVRFLLGHELKCIVVACGTVSSVALPRLLEMTDIPILGVIEPAVRAAVRATKNGPHRGGWHQRHHPKRDLP